MKGLIVKDLYMLFKYFRAFLILMIVFLLIPFVDMENTFFFFYPIVVISMIPVSLIAYDERFRWAKYCDALPLTRAQAVSAKYILCLILVSSVGIITATLLLVSSSPNNVNMLLSALITLGLLSPSMLLPVVFRFGAERGRIMYFVILGGFCAIASLIPQVSLPQIQSVPGILALPLLAALIFGISWLLSIRLYSKREL